MVGKKAIHQKRICWNRQSAREGSAQTNIHPCLNPISTLTLSSTSPLISPFRYLILALKLTPTLTLPLTLPFAGSIQRRLIKACMLNYDGTVRNSVGQLIQLRCGADFSLKMLIYIYFFKYFFTFCICVQVRRGRPGGWARGAPEPQDGHPLQPELREQVQVRSLLESMIYESRLVNKQKPTTTGCFITWKLG